MNPPAPREPYHRLTLIDLMGLVGASGLGLAAWMYHERDAAENFQEFFFSSRVCLLVSTPALAWAWLIALRGVVRLRVARREPGWLTALVIVATSGLGTFDAIWIRSGHGYLIMPSEFLDFLELVWITYVRSATFSGGSIAQGVGITWLILALSGGWRRAGGTLDRVGLGLGCMFLAQYLFFQGAVVWEYWHGR